MPFRTVRGTSACAQAIAALFREAPQPDREKSAPAIPTKWLARAVVRRAPNLGPACLQRRGSGERSSAQAQTTTQSTPGSTPVPRLGNGPDSEWLSHARASTGSLLQPKNEAAFCGRAL